MSAVTTCRRVVLFTNVIESMTLLLFTRYYKYDTEVLSCQKDRLVPASTSHKKDLIEKIDSLKAGGTSELK